MLAGATAVGARRLSSHSGVTDDDLCQRLPGDDVVDGAAHVVDRAASLDATPDEVWPWLVQLGKGRAGWYAPSWLVRLLVPDPSRRGAREVLPQFQTLHVGDVVPDWGPGSFTVLEVDRPRTLVYGSVHDGEASFLFSWAHVLQPRPDGTTRLYSRLRIRPPRRRWLGPALTYGGGLFDWATMGVMHAGLRENLRQSR